MLCNSKSQRSAHLRAPFWGNQNQFLHARHGDKTDRPPEIIVVRLRREESCFELLSWSISVAARPGDTVVAFHIGRNGGENLSSEICEELETADSQLKALKDLCELKQVALRTKFAMFEDGEVQLIKDASSLLATMLVVSPLSHHELRNIHKTGGLLVQRVHPGCSVVMVKDYKVIFYEENFAKEIKNSSAMSSAASHRAPVFRSKSLHLRELPLQRQISRNSRLSNTREKQAFCDLDPNISTGSKIWPVQTGDDSPRAVLDGPELSSESNISSVSSSSGSSLTHSLSRKGVLLCVSPQDDDDVTSQNTSHVFSKLRRSSSLTTFSSLHPTSSCIKKLPGPVDCTSIKSSFKTYIRSLQSTESMSHDPFTPAPDAQPNWRCFSYEELATATDNFSSDNMVGRGGHSEVYKGTLVNGKLVAIKRLTKGGSEERTEKDFLTELGIIGHVSHTNAIPLVGFCVEEGLHLIFNFSSNGSLAALLHGLNAPILDWTKRYRIAVGTARGLHYLHTACPRRIIHRDIKASNILLGPEFEPQISDFGLAKWLPEQWTQLNVFPVEGTFGYLAPEYFMHGVINEKTDVFAFGVLLLELITGQQPINKSQESLVIWAKPLLESMKTEDLADPRLAGEYDLTEMQTMVKAAALCVRSSALYRPFMGQVLDMLTEEDCESSFSIHALHNHRDSSEEYSSATYLSDLSRHREIALQF